MATENDLIIGIDLGTTNSCAAWVNNGKIQVIENSEGDYITPSFVYFIDAEKTIVGKNAMGMSANKPEYGIYEIKRFIGRPYNTKELQETLLYLPFEVVEHNGNPAVKILDHDLLRTAEHISSLVLQSIKNDATTRLGQNVNKAVITVPAHFTVFQRKATLKAAEMAGFTVMKLLSEPTAAALNYFYETRHQIELDNKCWLVYDLGGGTFDVAIAKTYVTKNQKHIKILCVDGDSNLGGHNFNNLILKYFIDSLSTNNDSCLDKRGLRRARNACNKAKENLSSVVETFITIEGFAGQKTVSIPFTRQKFDELCTHLFQKSIQIVDRCLKKSGIEKHNIDEIILAGGSTRIIKIQEMLQEYFNGKPLNKQLHPELCVAKGAALQAAFLSQNPNQKEKLQHFDITEVTSSSLGIGDTVDKMNFIIRKDTSIPTSGSKTFVNECDQQEAMNIQVYEGERASIKRNVKLGTLVISNLTPLPPCKCVVEVTMNIDANGILTVTAKEKLKDNTKNLEISLIPNVREAVLNDTGDEEDDKFLEFAELKLYFMIYCHAILFNIKSHNLQISHQSISTQCDNTLKELRNLESVNELEKVTELGKAIFRQCQLLVTQFNFEDMPPKHPDVA